MTEPTQQRPKVLCVCGHLWSEHRPRISFQNDQPVEIGRDECLFRADPFAPWYERCRCRNFLWEASRGA